MRKSWSHATNTALLLASIGMGAGAYAGAFPARLGALSFISVLIAMLCYGGAWWIARSPTALNMPNQAAYDALPEESQREVVACTLPFFYWSTTIWLGFLIVGFSFETTAVIVVAAVLAEIAEGALAIRFLFLKAPRKVREFQEAGQDRSG
jgi:ABC-type xylose transport system permease subunit